MTELMKKQKGGGGNFIPLKVGILCKHEVGISCEGMDAAVLCGVNALGCSAELLAITSPQTHLGAVLSWASLLPPYFPPAAPV